MGIKAKLARLYVLLTHDCHQHETRAWSAWGWGSDGKKRAFGFSRSSTKYTCSVCGKVRISHDQH
jgi:hypothetical protein